MNKSTTKIKTVRRVETAEVAIPEYEKTQNNVLKEIQLRRKELKSLAERVANDNFYKINYYYEGGKSFFPHDKDLQTVGKFFPYAECGPLYIDEPMLEAEEAACEKKKEAMAKLGHKYLVITRKMNELDCREAIA